MKKEYELLIDFDKNLKTVDQCKKILEDKTTLKELRNIKKCFDEHKVKYGELNEQFKSYTLFCEDISGEIEQIEEELSEKEKVLLNDCGSDIRKINNTEMIINRLKESISEKSKELDDKLNEENKIKKEIRKVSLELKKLKEMFLNIKKEFEDKNKIAKEDLSIAEDACKMLEKQIPEELLQTYLKVKNIKKNPITFIKNNICTGCNLGISMTKADEIKNAKKVIFCDNCGRIIFLEK
ncbi:C4-type zinc ribbon domain-containing protein [Clostridium sediminicola]|uniref:zinc ribbon domain-containing protein n=1 Tax=Clostridium sediminicola TaxID=3114879 RepID=UPI0031F27613